MEPGAGLWVLLLVVLAALFALTFRRMSRLVARTRELERFQASVAELDGRFGAAADPLVGRLDEIRRRSGDPEAVAELVAPAIAAIRGAVTDAAALRAPAGLVDRPPALVRELERAVRALELIEHGLAGLVNVRGPRELEAQTSLKRGALNLRHAREAFGTTARGVAELRPADLLQPRPLTLRPQVGTAATLAAEGLDTNGNGSSDPRM